MKILCYIAIQYLEMSDILSSFEADCSQFPAQYTPEWFARIDTVGGSEINDARTNPHMLAVKKIMRRITEKIPTPHSTTAIDPARDPRVIMAWGTLFEPLLCEYIARTLSIDIRCRSLSYFRGCFRYSPDGAFIDSNGDCALLELKNPMIRVWRDFSEEANTNLAQPHTFTPAPQEVPAHYIPQLQAGMHLLPFIRYAFYVEAIYRRTTTRGTPTALGYQKMAGVRNAPALDNGVIGFYRKTTHHQPEDTPINFGSRANDELLCDALRELRSDNPFIPLYFDTTGTPFRKHTELPRETDDGILIGYMPWALLGVHAARVMPDPAFMSSDLVQSIEYISARVREYLDDESRADEIISRIERDASVTAATSIAATLSDLRGRKKHNEPVVEQTEPIHQATPPDYEVARENIW